MMMAATGIVPTLRAVESMIGKASLQQMSAAFAEAAKEAKSQLPKRKRLMMANAWMETVLTPTETDASGMLIMSIAAELTIPKNSSLMSNAALVKLMPRKRKLLKMSVLMETELTLSEMAVTGMMPTQLDAVNMTLMTSSLLINAAFAKQEQRKRSPLLKASALTEVVLTLSEMIVHGILKMLMAVETMIPLNSLQEINAVPVEEVLRQHQK